MDVYWTALQEFLHTHIMPYAWNIVIAVVMLLVGLWLIARIRSGMDKLLQQRMEATLARFLARITQILLLLVLVIIVLDRLGVNTTSLVAIVGAASLAVGLALKDSLGNFAAGVMLIMFRIFRVGHYVEIAGTSGTVEEIRIFATVLTTADNKVVTVPNGKILSGNIVNYSEKPTRRVDMQFRVGYEADLAKVKRILEEVVAADDRCLAEPAPTIVVGDLAENSVNFLCRPWVNAADYWSVKWEMTEEVKLRFDAAGINIPLPQMDVHFNRPSESETD